MRRLVVLALVLCILIAGCSLSAPGDKQPATPVATSPSAPDADKTSTDGPEDTSAPPLTAGPEGTAGEGPAATAGQTGPAGTSVPVPADVTATVPPPPPVVGGRITEIIPLYPQTLNPLFSENESQWRVESLVFNGLMEINPAQRAPAPALAADLSISPDNLTYTFKLRPGVKWHDGAPLTAEDVVWTYNLLRSAEMGAPLYPYAQRIRNVAAVDSSTVRFALSEPYSPFLGRLGTVPLIPKKPFAGLAGPGLRARLLSWGQPVGTGPFKFVSARPGQSIDLLANPDYFRGAPLLDAYNFRVLRDTASIQQALNSGEADLAWLSPVAMGEISEQDFLTQTVMDTPTTTMLFFNLGSITHAKLRQDRRVRQALVHALNMERLPRTTGGALRPATAFQPPTSPAYPPDDSAPYLYDPGRAKALLQAAGWRDPDRDGVRQKGNQKLSLTLHVNRVPATFPVTLGTSYSAAIERMALDWKAVGVQVIVREEGWEQLASRLFNTHEFDMALLSVSADADPDQSYLWSTQAYDQGFNIGRYSSPSVDTLLTQGLKTGDPTQRLMIYRQVEKALEAELPAAPIGVTQMVLLQNNRLIGTGADYWSALGHAGVEKWWVQDGR